MVLPPTRSAKLLKSFKSNSEDIKYNCDVFLIVRGEDSWLFQIYYPQTHYTYYTENMYETENEAIMAAFVQVYTNQQEW